MHHSYFHFILSAAVVAALGLNPCATIAAENSETLRQQLSELRQQMRRKQQDYEKQSAATAC